MGRLSSHGREEGLQVWEGMKGFHGNLRLPVANVVIQSPQAPFQWTLKPLSQEAKPRTWIQKLDAIELEERGRERPDRLVFLSATKRQAPRHHLKCPWPYSQQKPVFSKQEGFQACPPPLAAVLHYLGSKDLGDGLLQMTCFYFPGSPTSLGPRVGEAKYQGLFPLCNRY